MKLLILTLAVVSLMACSSARVKEPLTLEEELKSLAEHKKEVMESMSPSLLQAHKADEKSYSTKIKLSDEDYWTLAHLEAIEEREQLLQNPVLPNPAANSKWLQVNAKQELRIHQREFKIHKQELADEISPATLQAWNSGVPIDLSKMPRKELKALYKMVELDLDIRKADLTIEDPVKNRDLIEKTSREKAEIEEEEAETFSPKQVSERPSLFWRIVLALAAVKAVQNNQPKNCSAYNIGKTTYMNCH
jgi:hypothetical protein